MYGFFVFAESPRPWLRICLSCATVSCFPITVRAGTSAETPPRPRSPWHWAQANCAKSWAPAATLALTEVAPPLGTVPTTVTVFVTVFVPPQPARMPASRRPHPTAAPSRATVRARATGRAYAGQDALSSCRLVAAEKITAPCDPGEVALDRHDHPLARISKAGLAADEHDAEHDGCSGDHQRHRHDHHRPSATGCVLAHERTVAGEQGDEREQRQEQHRVDRLGDEQDRHERRSRHEHDERADADHERVGAVEDRFLPNWCLDSCLAAKRLADRIGGREREDRCRQQCRSEQANPEQGRRVRAGQRWPLVLAATLPGQRRSRPARRGRDGSDASCRLPPVSDCCGCWVAAWSMEGRFLA